MHASNISNKQGKSVNIAFHLVVINMQLSILYTKLQASKKKNPTIKRATVKRIKIISLPKGKCQI